MAKSIEINLLTLVALDPRAGMSYGESSVLEVQGRLVTEVATSPSMARLIMKVARKTFERSRQSYPWSRRARIMRKSEHIVQGEG